MTTEIFIIIMFGAASMILLFCYVSACRRADGWRKLYEEKKAALAELKHKHLCADMDESSRKWLSEENTRLHIKLADICAQIRKMKGRGKSGVNPIHHF